MWRIKFLYFKMEIILKVVLASASAEAEDEVEEEEEEEVDNVMSIPYFIIFSID